MKFTPEQRFWKHVDRRGPDECWPWTGTVSHNGYGRFWLNGRNTPARRFAWECANGPMPPGMLGLHTCDNPPCCNPKHIFPGTQLDNIRDRDAKGRQASGDRNGARLHPESLHYRGDNHWTRQHPDRVLRGNDNGSHLHPERTPRGEDAGPAKLTWEQVETIRTFYATGQHTFKGLGRMFNVSGVSIRNIVKYRTWAHRTGDVSSLP